MFVSFDICWDSRGGLGLVSGSPSQRRARIPTYSQLFGVEIDVELFSCQTSTCRALCDYLRKLVHSLMTFLWLFLRLAIKIMNSYWMSLGKISYFSVASR